MLGSFGLALARARRRAGADDRRERAGGDHTSRLPYPQYAKYKGAGNVKDAANWACSTP